MKKNIHPDYCPEARVSCSCGNAFTTGSSEKEIKVEICSACHPFFTGKSKFIDAKGRVEKFEEKRAAAKKRQQQGERDKKKKIKKQVQGKSSQKKKPSR